MLRRSLVAALLAVLMLIPLRACSSDPGLGNPTASSTPLPAGDAAGQAAPSSSGDGAAAAAPGLPVEIEQARRARVNGDLETALRVYQEVAADGIAPAEWLLELAGTQRVSGDPVAARDTLRRLLAASPGDPLGARARLLLAIVNLEAGEVEAIADTVEASTAPDGLADLAILLRAEAADLVGDGDAAAAELSRQEMRESTNRLLLERGGQLAEKAEYPRLAGELYARGARYFGWTAERVRLYAAAGRAFERAGRWDEAIEQHRTLVEQYGWTDAGQESGDALERLGGLTPYYRGLVAINAGRLDEARTALSEAIAIGDHASEASSRLDLLEEAVAWRVADDSGTVADYRWMQDYYPEGVYAAEALFREGFVHFEAGRISTALDIWERGASRAGGDHEARLRLWAGKALETLGREVEARDQWRQAADTHPTGYYAVRARDLLAGLEAWPRSKRLPGRAGAEETAAAVSWLAGWAGSAAAPNAAEEMRAQRGAGLLALGLQAEAAAELNGLIAESGDPHFLFRIARQLAERQLWASSSRAAARVVSLSPARTVAEAPRALQRLVYPAAYPELVAAESERRSLDPLLLLALMHQESRYDPLALSPAGARGLTQVMPATGRDIASALGRDALTTDDLHRPAVAVQFGAWYLADQISSFGGDPFLGLAAYNAGGRPVSRWAAADPDLFVERIDYSETRSYVRQIYLHHAIYRGLGP